MKNKFDLLNVLVDVSLHPGKQMDVHPQMTSHNVKPINFKMTFLLIVTTEATNKRKGKIMKQYPLIKTLFL